MASITASKHWRINSLSQKIAPMKFCPDCGKPLSSKIIEGSERAACLDEQCQFVHWNNPVPVVAALVDYAGQYIIARNHQWPAGIFSVITGYLEQNESPQQSVIREVAEELSLHAAIKRFIGVYSFHEQNQVIFCYEVVATGSLKTNHELAEVKLLSPKQLSQYDFPPLAITQNIIKDWIDLNATVE